ncbi:MAG: type II toxin-antitoxin system HicA family toxin [Ignavibacteriaceae bacterium]|nr:type II toxin-antitoxin system HicA family toxin [Ignavibacteriaceae bacterium]
MKIPRDVDAKALIKALNKIGYQETRQVGSHVRLSITRDGKQFHITIPNHNPIKIGTLNNILKEISNTMSLSKDQLLKKLF